VRRFNIVPSFHQEFEVLDVAWSLMGLFGRVGREVLV
jgi:hypothetical protein